MTSVEPYVDDNDGLVSPEAWNEYLDSLPNTVNEERTHDEIINNVASAITRAIKKRLPTDENANVGVLFSGGVDSTLIAHELQKLNVPFTCYTVGYHDGESKLPEDTEEAKKVARAEGFKQKTVLLDNKTAQALFKETKSILGKELLNVVNAGVGGVAITGITEGLKEDVTVFFSGLGAEELFAGYDRHEKALAQNGYEGLHKECINGLHTMYERDLRRDKTIATHFTITLATPFLDEELTRIALTIPAREKMNETTYDGRARGDRLTTKKLKKLVLRAAAERLGLPHERAYRPKRAAQYGSRLNNALAVLAKKAGFQYKKEYLESL